MCLVKGCSGLPWWPGSGCKVFPAFFLPKSLRWLPWRNIYTSGSQGPQIPGGWTQVNSAIPDNTNSGKSSLAVSGGGDTCGTGFTEDAFKHTLPCRHFVRTGSSIAMDVTDEDVEAGVSPKENDSHDCTHGCLIGLPAASFGCKPFSYPRPTGQGTHSIFRAGCNQKPVCIWESQKPGPSLISFCSLYS